MSSNSRYGGSPRPRRPQGAGNPSPRTHFDGGNADGANFDGAGSTPAAEAPALAVATSFAELGVPAPIAAALQLAGCHTPLPIQAATLPSSLAGRDVLGRGRTGSGKTVAFAVPTVVAIAASTNSRRANAPRALIVVPTRELAGQVAGVVGPIATAMGLRVATIHGGVNQGPQVTALRRGVDVVIACPGRLEDLIEQRHCTLAAVEVCVLDEADHLADLGFLPAVKRLLDQTPAGGQRLLFSATLDRAVDSLVARYLNHPVVHSVDAVDVTPPELEHHTFSVAPHDKATVVRELASGAKRSLLFTRTKQGAKKLAVDLNRNGIPAVELHGNLSQPQRDRNLAAFIDGRALVLVATDIAARGIHVDDINLVVHVDPPTEHKAYLHRSGRTARAGARGSVVTVILPDQSRGVASMIRQAGIRPKAVRVAPGAPETVALTGPPAERVFIPVSSLTAKPTRPTPPSAARTARRRPRPGGTAPYASAGRSRRTG